MSWGFDNKGVLLLGQVYHIIFEGMWEYLYKTTKMPVVPMYGLFPVKLKTHIGSPIYPTPGMTPEELAKLTVEAIEGMISQHQVLPGNLGQVGLAGNN